MEAQFKLNGNSFCSDCYWEVKYQRAKLMKKRVNRTLESMKGAFKIDNLLKIIR